jgi:hypothetical protein
MENNVQQRESRGEGGMNYDMPLMEEEIKSYIVSSDINPLDVLAILKVRNTDIQTVTGLRQWWEPIEDEL